MTSAPRPDRGPISSAAERMRELLAAAEDIAEDIRREASAEAERYLAERRREADAFVADRRARFEQALEAVRLAGPEIERRLAEVTGALERALEDASAPAAPGAREPELAASAEPPAPPAPEPTPAEPELRQAEPRGGAHVRQRALIRATQLAVQGADRVTVQETIEHEFELADAAGIVEEILGKD